MKWMSADSSLQMLFCQQKKKWIFKLLAWLSIVSNINYELGKWALPLVVSTTQIAPCSVKRFRVKKKLRANIVAKKRATEIIA